VPDAEWAKMLPRLGKVLAGLGLGLGLSGCLTAQQPGPDPAVTAANEAARLRAAQDRKTSTYPLLARYDACIRADFAVQYQKDVEKSTAADHAFAACTTAEHALNRWFIEYPVASEPIRASMADHKLRLKEELISQYP
jgi:hypothetical protein